MPRLSTYSEIQYLYQSDDAVDRRSSNLDIGTGSQQEESDGGSSSGLGEEEISGDSSGDEASIDDSMHPIGIRVREQSGFRPWLFIPLDSLK